MKLKVLCNLRPIYAPVPRGRKWLENSFATDGHCLGHWFWNNLHLSEYSFKMLYFSWYYINGFNNRNCWKRRLKHPGIFLLYLSLILCKSAGASIRISPPKVILGKDVLKICSKVIGGHPCRSVISVNLQSKSIEITLRHGCSPVNLHNTFS